MYAEAQVLTALLELLLLWRATSRKHLTPFNIVLLEVVCITINGCRGDGCRGDNIQSVFQKQTPIETTNVCSRCALTPPRGDTSSH